MSEILPDAKLTIKSCSGELLDICYENKDLRHLPCFGSQALSVREKANGFTVSIVPGLTHIVAHGQSKIIENLSFSAEKIIR